ncbi:MAG TPA: discoidin domain-containing protein, partial [Phototrophicaceae bacterium]|nr:discoidin domain-containing protein [Phototrophicaceae bacterium]
MKKLLTVLTLMIGLLVLSLTSLTGVIGAQSDPAVPSQFIEHNGQELFLNGINLAWINFGRDLKDFNEVEFVAALDQIAAAKGNTMRWWLHTAGSVSPVYGADGKVTGLGENDLVNLKRGVDLAYERGILILPTLWSHDMMNDNAGIPTAFNKLMIEDPDYTQAYIDNALIPMVTALKGHPGIIAWEIFNEPEGTTTPFGWTDERTEMPFIQQFVNKLAGAIHRADPDVKVTNGSWNMQVLTNVGGMMNYYTDARLIEAGGDPDGTLDFYTVHYYPEWFDETTSPFHNPYSHWELDKPLVVAEFPAKAIADLGMGFKPKHQLRNSMESYEYLLENGYAGALAWTFYTSPHGKMLDAAPGMLRVNNLAPEHVQIDLSNLDHIPVVLKQIDNLVTALDTPGMPDYVNLGDVFNDVEDGTALTYTVSINTKPEVVEASISDTHSLSLTFPSGAAGSSSLEITATDSGGNTSKVKFVVQLVDPNQGNVALGKPTVASSIENQGYLAEYATDGLENTRWSTEYADGQTLDVDLGGVFTISQVILKWEAAFGGSYEIQVWDGQAWQTVYTEPNGDGQMDDITLPEAVDTRFVRFNGIKRATEWGFSLWEFEVNGKASDNASAALETPPDTFAGGAVADSGDQVTTPATTSETTLLNSFEADVENWKLADYWAGGKGLSVSADGASDGAQSLAIDAVYTGGSWQEAGASVQPEGGADWSGYQQLAMDVYLPEGATDFIGQIFVKTGADWTWANTPDTPLVAGQWTTITADLSTLGDMTALNEYGVKVGTSVTAYEGAVLIDNIRLVTVTEAQEAESPATATTTEATVLNSFEADVENWKLADYWAGGKGLSVSTNGASDGAQSLAIDAVYTGGSWQEAGASVQLEGGADWSDYQQLAM